MPTQQIMTMLDGQQVLRSAFDDSTQALRVENISSSTIGAVTIKDGTTNDIATVTPANALKVDGSAVTQPVSLASVPLAPGASTAAKQDTGNTSVASIDTKTPALGQALAASSVPIILTASQLSTLTPLTSVTVTQSTGTNLHVVVDSSALSSGASTSALQTSGNTSLATIATNTTGSATSANQTAEISKLTSIDGKIVAVNTGAVVVSSSALPTGAATDANLGFIVTSSNQTAANTADLVLPQNSPTSGQSGPLILTASTVAAPTYASGTSNALSTTLAGRLRVDATGTTQTITGSINLAGKTPTEFKRNDYVGIPVSTGAYTQLIASTVSASTEMFIFDSSGQTLVIAFGGVGSEVDQFLVVPGGNGTVPVPIAASTRISIKAVSGAASVGEIDINIFN